MAYLGRPYGEYDYGDGAYGASVVINVDPYPGRAYGGWDYGAWSYGESLSLDQIVITSDAAATSTKIVPAVAEAMSTTSGAAAALTAW